MSEQTSQLSDVTYTREFDAPRALVFRCMIEPEHLTEFWGPVGMHTPLDRIKVDARPGGMFETVMIDPDGNEYPMRAEYIEIVEPERIVWKEVDTGVQTTSTFVDLGGGRTEVIIYMEQVEEQYRSPEAKAGFMSSLDRFAEHLASLT